MVRCTTLETGGKHCCFVTVPAVSRGQAPETTVKLGRSLGLVVEEEDDDDDDTKMRVWLVVFLEPRNKISSGCLTIPRRRDDGKRDHGKNFSR